jgi:hypothetical protein
VEIYTWVVPVWSRVRSQGLGGGHVTRRRAARMPRHCTVARVEPALRLVTNGFLVDCYGMGEMDRRYHPW